MAETDDRLVGDFVWELFPAAAPQRSSARRYRSWARTAASIAVAWAVFPPAGVAAACFEASFRDFRSGWRLARAIPDAAGGRICARFAYAWGAWKLGSTAFVLMFVTAILATAGRGRTEEFPPAAATAMLLWMGGFVVAAVLTAIGLVQAYRSGMRVWIGEGINQARTLLLGMLIVGFVGVVLLPMCVLLTVAAPPGAADAEHLKLFMTGLYLTIFGGPVILLLILDWCSRHLVADRPAKFGPKVPALGKWD